MTQFLELIKLHTKYRLYVKIRKAYDVRFSINAITTLGGFALAWWTQIADKLARYWTTYVQMPQIVNNSLYTHVAQVPMR